MDQIDIEEKPKTKKKWGKIDPGRMEIIKKTVRKKLRSELKFKICLTKQMKRNRDNLPNHKDKEMFKIEMKELTSNQLKNEVRKLSKK